MTRHKETQQQWHGYHVHTVIAGDAAEYDFISYMSEELRETYKTSSGTGKTIFFFCVTKYV